MTPNWNSLNYSFSTAFRKYSRFWIVHLRCIIVPQPKISLNTKNQYRVILQPLLELLTYLPVTHRFWDLFHRRCCLCMHEWSVLLQFLRSLEPRYWSDPFLNSQLPLLFGEERLIRRQRLQFGGEGRLFVLGKTYSLGRN